MKSVASDKTFEKNIENLSMEMEPKRDLWIGIEKAIATKSQETAAKPNKVVVPLAWAASICAAVILSWGAFEPVGQENSSAISVVNIMKKDFTRQKQLVLTAYGQSKTPELSAEIQTQIAELTSARKAIYQALENDPNNSELLNLLRWTQDQELALIEQVYSPQWQTI